MGTIMPELGMIRQPGSRRRQLLRVGEPESAGTGRLKFWLSLEARDHRGRNLRKRRHFLRYERHVRANGLGSDTLCVGVIDKSEAANTSMRPVEVKHLRRCDVDLVKKLVHVRRSKNETSHRVIPLNAAAIEAAARMFERADLLGHTEPEHYLWPACQWGRYDANNPMLKWDTAWRALRDAAGLPGLRFHDLRHTVITELAEMGVADHVLESISGHLSRRMLEHYSHIRIDAKRQALDALDAARRSTAHNGEGNGDDADQTEIPAIVEVSDDLTSQSRHSLVCVDPRLPVNC
jgi:integrase